MPNMGKNHGLKHAYDECRTMDELDPYLQRAMLKKKLQKISIAVGTRLIKICTVQTRSPSVSHNFHHPVLPANSSLISLSLNKSKLARQPTTRLIRAMNRMRFRNTKDLTGVENTPLTRRPSRPSSKNIPQKCTERRLCTR